MSKKCFFTMLIVCSVISGCFTTGNSYYHADEYQTANTVLKSMCLTSAKMEAANCIRNGFQQDGTSTYHAYQCGVNLTSPFTPVQNQQLCQALNNIYNNINLPIYNVLAEYTQQNLLQWKYPNCGANYVDDLYSCQFEGRLDDNNRPSVSFPDIQDTCGYYKGVERKLCLCKKYDQECVVVLGM